MNTNFDANCIGPVAAHSFLPNPNQGRSLLTTLATPYARLPTPQLPQASAGTPCRLPHLGPCLNPAPTHPVTFIDQDSASTLRPHELPPLSRPGPRFDHVAASGSVEARVSQDMIDNLAQPTACNHILLVGGSFRMEVGRGIVYPHQSMLDDI
jgi:hypothetical protein